LSRPLTGHQTNNAIAARSYAKDVAEDAQQVKKPRAGRPKGTKITNGASPKTKKATTSSSKKPKKPVASSKPKRVAESTHEKMLKKVKELKHTALLDQPKGLPTNSWLAYFVQNHVPVAEVKALSSKFKDLPQSEKDVSLWI